MKYSQAIVTLNDQVNVYQTYCRMCQSHAEELIIGDVYRYFDAKSGDLIGLDHPGGWLAQYLIDIEVEYNAVRVPLYERLPTSDYCSDCQAEIDHQQAEFMQEVERGGVRWTCEMCTKKGIVIANDSQGFSKAVRDSMQIFAPEMVTVKFNNCGQHAAEDDPEDGEFSIH